MTNIYLVHISIPEKIKMTKKITQILQNNIFTVNRKYRSSFNQELEFKNSYEITGSLTRINQIYEIVMLLTEDFKKLIHIVIIKQNSALFLSTKYINRIINKLKKDKVLFQLDTDNKIYDNIISNNINLLYVLKKSHTNKKVEIYQQYMKFQDQQIVADNLGISQQQVSYHLKTAHWKQIQVVEKSLRESLELYDLAIETTQYYYKD